MLPPVGARSPLDDTRGGSERIEGPSTELRVGTSAPRGTLRGEAAVRSTDPARGLALQTALDRLTGGRHTDHEAPDAWVTALRVLPARSARYAPFPDGISEPLRDVLVARGINAWGRAGSETRVEVDWQAK